MNRVLIVSDASSSRIYAIPNFRPVLYYDGVFIMFIPVAKSLIIFLFAIVFSICASIPPVHATTFSFKSPGKPGNEGVLTGKITYDQDAVNLALNKPNRRSSSLTLEELGKDPEFKFEYISPYSGVKHTEETLCDSSFANDINDTAPNSLYSSIDKRGPFFQFSTPEEVGSFYLVSCVGDSGNLDSSISERDSSVAFSELQIVFGRGLLIDANNTGIKAGRLYQKKFPINFKFESD